MVSTEKKHNLASQFYWDLTEDDSQTDSPSHSSEELLQRGGGEASIIFWGLENTCSQAYILVKVYC